MQSKCTCKILSLSLWHTIIHYSCYWLMTLWRKFTLLRLGRAFSIAGKLCVAANSTKWAQTYMTYNLLCNMLFLVCICLLNEASWQLMWNTVTSTILWQAIVHANLLCPDELLYVPCFIHARIKSTFFLMCCKSSHLVFLSYQHWAFHKRMNTMLL